MLDWTFYHNTVRAWLAATIALLVVGLALLLIRRLLVQRLGRVAEHTATSADDMVVDLIRRTRLFFILTAALAAASLFVELPTRARDIGRVLGTIALFVQLAIWGNGLISFWLKNYAEEKAESDLASRTTIAAFGFVARGFLWVMLVLVALNRLGFDVTALITGLGVGGIAIALAVQNILGDLFAALAIVLDKPFVVGDTIIVDTLVGTVEHIGLKTTRLRSLSGEQVIVSNADLLKSRIRNMKRMQERRVMFSLGVSYDTPPDVMERIPGMIREAIEAQSPVRFDRSHFTAYGDSALTIETVYYLLTADYATYMMVHQAVNLTILRRFAAERIEFAYPTRTLFVRNGPSAPPVSARSASEGERDEGSSLMSS